MDRQENVPSWLEMVIVHMKSKQLKLPTNTEKIQPFILTTWGPMKYQQVKEPTGKLINISSNSWAHMVEYKN